MNTGVKLSCDDLRFLYVAGLSGESRPRVIDKLMDEHKETCGCTRSKGYYNDLLGVGVSKEMEEKARRLIRDLTNRVTLSNLYEAFELGHRLSLNNANLTDGYLVLKDDTTKELFVLDLGIN